MKDNDTRAAEELFPSGHQPPSDYHRSPQYARIVCDKDVAVAMRDGVTVVVDVYRPDAAGRFPVLFAFGVHSKELQGNEPPKNSPPQPSWSSLWLGHAEAGDTEYFVSRGYVHVIGSPRGFLKSGDGGSREWDSYDVIEWIAKQPWCDGNIGMVGIGAFASEQFHAARQRPPLLKAIFPYDPRGAYGKFGGFREEYPGGVLHAFRYLMDHFSSVHTTRGAPGDLPPLQGDERRLRQVFGQLLANAVKFTGAGGRVMITAAVSSGDAVLITVADTGIGIAESDLAAVFEPFSQVDGGFSRRFPGSGLGLYVARALVRAHDGQLTLQSRRGVGTTARVLLPGARPHPTHSDIQF